MLDGPSAMALETLTLYLQTCVGEAAGVLITNMTCLRHWFADISEAHEAWLSAGTRQGHDASDDTTA